MRSDADHEAHRVGAGVAAGGLAVVTVAAVAGTLAVRRSDIAGGVAISVWLLVTAAVGALVAARRPGHPCGWLLGAAAGLVAVAVAVFTTDYTQRSLAGAERWPLTTAAGWLTTWVAIPGFAAFLVLFLTFPTGRLPSPRWRWVLGAAVVGTILLAAGPALRPGPLPVASTLDNPSAGGANRLIRRHVMHWTALDATTAS
ncbi:MAG: hypothetical protein ACRDPR_09275 [Nocardioidaceae bacterium]